MTWGQPLEGTDHGPRLLREAGLTGMLAALGWRVQEPGALAVTPPAPDAPNVDPAAHGRRRDTGQSALCLSLSLSLSLFSSICVHF